MKTKSCSKPSITHFSERAGRYNASAHWVEDTKLIAGITRAAGPLRGAALLDLAVGTGAIAKAFKGRAKITVGVDICAAMSDKAAGYVDLLVYTRAEAMPFPEAAFDICTCRQGLQFMDLHKTLAEVHRVLKPGGRAVFCHLTSYGGADDAATFLIQQLRNPARKNFFSPGDLARAATGYFRKAQTAEYITRESVGTWTANASISQANKARIMRLYRTASAAFRNKHKVCIKNGDIFDSMRMEIVTAYK